MRKVSIIDTAFATLIEGTKDSLGKDIHRPVKRQEYRILLVEDGSVDVDDLISFFDEHGLKIKVVVYRQGSIPPTYLKWR